MIESNVFANALLKDGKLMFWWSGSKCNMPEDFYKDFMIAGMNMKEELATGKYRLETELIDHIGSKEEEDFYRQFPLHEDFKGRKPYAET